GDHARLGPASAEFNRRRARAAAEVDDVGGHLLAEVFERFEQARLDLALQLGGGGIAAGSARKRAADLAAIEDVVRVAHAASSCARKPAIACATSSAWVRKGACPPCSICAN